MPETGTDTWATSCQCKTCWRMRPEEEFLMRVNEGLSYLVNLCRSCRVTLWNNPDDPHEGR
jgi:hypothetical protein